MDIKAYFFILLVCALSQVDGAPWKGVGDVLYSMIPKGSDTQRSDTSDHSHRKYHRHVHATMKPRRTTTVETPTVITKPTEPSSTPAPTTPTPTSTPTPTTAKPTTSTPTTPKPTTLTPTTAKPTTSTPTTPKPTTLTPKTITPTPDTKDGDDILDEDFGSPNV